MTKVRHTHNAYADDPALRNAPAPETLDPAGSERAWREITSWPGYAPTPLVELPGMAKRLRIGALRYKDESERFGLNSFKALGGAYAVYRLLFAMTVERVDGNPATSAQLMAGAFSTMTRTVTVCSATDGNHGRSVAWGARMFGCNCVIFVPSAVSDGRVKAIEQYGAVVIRVAGNYDETVRHVQTEADRNGWFVISDTSYEGYIDVPRDVMQVEEATGVPTIGHVPRIGRAGRSVHRIANFVVDKPNSAFAESLRTLRTALLLSNVDRPPKVVMFTSAVPGEGKTLTALSTARAAAMSGQKVLIIDCDLRKPSVQDFLEVPNDSDIVECLSHEKGLEDVIQMDFKSGAHFILAGPKVPNPTDVLASDQMRDFLAALTDAYDLIVLDTPPVMAVSDSLVLSRMADKIVFLVRWERTRREATVTAVRRILESGAELAGIVLTQVDAKRHDRYYNRASGYYGEYNKYYSD